MLCSFQFTIVTRQRYPCNTFITFQHFTQRHFHFVFSLYYYGIVFFVIFIQRYWAAAVDVVVFLTYVFYSRASLLLLFHLSHNMKQQQREYNKSSKTIINIVMMALFTLVLVIFVVVGRIRFIVSIWPIASSCRAANADWKSQSISIAHSFHKHINDDSNGGISPGLWVFIQYFGGRERERKSWAIKF